ncbi:heavy-metal-associated domain-containing protein [Clostridium estertheticum]|uniref:heavy-metal-associated domain-containing protein n=1 Tax=Clostridium estertheticum TaxID=238834 RepID=UPI001C0DED2A|nr:cation transporter [Clostridium estertheticum]MBU3074917.1 cation transporter [Clostridium estertheticum]MBU3165132.1 cation transporter [Clostridium estertheticum]
MKKKIYVEGMSCGHCVNHVSEALKEIGAKDVEVNLESKLATAGIGDNITDDVIKAAIEDAGYDVVKIEKA